MLAALGRIDPTTYAADHTLANLLVLVPFGLPAEPPQPGRGLRGVEPGVAVDDKVVVWNGGLWDWFDPDSAILAVAQLAGSYPRLRLVFLGTRHPNPAIGEPPAARRARALAEELGIAGRHVLFREWTPYAQRGACLIEADAAISLHLEGVETRYASRTRLLDCVWAGVPVVSSAGDVLGDDLTTMGLAIGVPPGNVHAVAAALAALLDEPDARAARAQAFARLRGELTWDRAVAPLATFLGEPRRQRSPASEPTSPSIGRAAGGWLRRWGARGSKAETSG
jgi:glycosyltransferase involved in cell wall biosynthesis